MAFADLKHLAFEHELQAARMDGLIDTAAIFGLCAQEGLGAVRQVTLASVSRSQINKSRAA